ncbi:MAG: hypothetical protein HN764_01635 [Gammaproteobacteria bacterium]|nr:hypothetical protein [Gammaproteobacteria bacterium]
MNDFLITSHALADELDSENQKSNLKEKLLLRQDDGELSLSLYLHTDVVEKMLEDDPVQNLHEGNMQDFCLALEGVSHFLYLSWNASFDRSVTMLEMELQAEIDKFVMLVLCLEKQNRRAEPGKLRQILFETANYHKELGESERQRYRDASYFAEKYCWQLESDYLNNRGRQQLLQELRQFYRLTQMDKLSRINRPN